MLRVPALECTSSTRGDQRDQGDTPRSPNREGSELKSARQPTESINGDAMKNADIFNSGPAQEIWRNLARNLTASDRERYFLQAYPSEIKERSVKVQDLLLRMATPRNERTNIGREASPPVPVSAQSLHASIRTFSNDDGARDNTELDFTIDELIEIIKAADSDDTYATLCLLFDREIDPRYEMIALPHLDAPISQVVGISAIISDILQYAHWRSFGIKDPTEHMERKARLLGVMEILRDLRAFLGLSTYEEIRCRYL